MRTGTPETIGPCTARSCKVIAMEKRKLRSQAKLRSQSWFGGNDKDGFIHRSWMRAEGFAPDVFDGRPVIGICNSWSELTSCNVHLRRVAESVKRGVWEAGGWPLEFPTISLGETYMRPTTMLFRIPIGCNASSRTSRPIRHWPLSAAKTMSAPMANGSRAQNRSLARCCGGAWPWVTTTSASAPRDL